MKCQSSSMFQSIFYFFFFNDTATTEIYTLSLHDALPIWRRCRVSRYEPRRGRPHGGRRRGHEDSQVEDLWPAKSESVSRQDRKSTRLNSSHSQISYAVFCLKKKKNDMKGKQVMTDAAKYR